MSCGLASETLQVSVFSGRTADGAAGTQATHEWPARERPRPLPWAL